MQALDTVEKDRAQLKSIVYIIPGDPIPWQRAGRSGSRYYDKQKNEKIAWGLHFNRQFSLQPFTGPIKIDVIFYIRIFKTLEKKYGPALEGYPHYDVPDNSNLLKFLEDALNTVAWKDDRIISRTDHQKIWSYNPRTEIIITPLPDYKKLLIQ